MSDDEMEDYGFEYSDEDPEEEDVDIENQYYNAKGRAGAQRMQPRLHVIGLYTDLGLTGPAGRGQDSSGGVAAWGTVGVQGKGAAVAATHTYSRSCRVSRVLQWHRHARRRRPAGSH